MEQDYQSQTPYPQQPVYGVGPGRQYAQTGQGLPLYGMGITAHALRQLATARKWAFFLAIMGFIGCAFMVLGGALFAMSFGLVSEFFPGVGVVEQGPVILTVVMYLVLAVVYFFPAFFLLRFSLQAKRALAVHSPDLITDALRYLKLFFAYIGIALIVALALSVIGVIVAIAVAGSVYTTLGV